MPSPNDRMLCKAAATGPLHRAEFEDTISLLEIVKYDLAFLFHYSMRERTHAHRRLSDDVSEAVKKERLVRMIEVFKRN